MQKCKEVYYPLYTLDLRAQWGRNLCAHELISEGFADIHYSNNEYYVYELMLEYKEIEYIK